MADAVAAREPTTACEFAALDRARAPGLRAHASWLAPVAVGALLRAGYMLYAEGDPGDGISRTITAYEWLGGGRPLFGAHPWPELNYLIPALAIRITGELYWGVRVLYMVLALAVVPLAYRIAADLQDTDAGELAAWTMALLPYHIVLSTDGARGEALFVVGAMMSVAGALHWSKHGYRLRWAVCAAGGALLAQGLRFDGIVFAGGVGLAMLLTAFGSDALPRRKRALTGVAMFAALTLAYSLALGLAWQLRYSDPLHFLHTAQENSFQFLQHGNHPRWPMWLYLPYTVAFWPIGALYAATPLIGLLAMIGLLADGFNRQRQLLSIPVALYAAFCIYGTLSLTTQPQIRYASILGWLLVPYVGLGIARLANGALPSKRLRNILMLAVAAAVVVQAAASVPIIWHLPVLTRQLSGTTLLQRSPYAARRALEVAIGNGTPGRDMVIVQASVKSSYASLAKPFREGPLHVELTNIYRTPNLVMTQREYTEALLEKLIRSRFVMVDVAGYEMGFVDGLGPDPIGSQLAPDMTRLSWRGHDFVVLGRFGSIALLMKLDRGQ